MKYYLKINGGSLQETRDLGMSFTGLELQNMQADSAALRWTRRRASDACPLAHNDTVEVFADERRIFRGRARLGTVTSEGASVQIVGPWSHLEEQIYQLSLAPGSYGMPDGKVVGDTYAQLYAPLTSLWTGTSYQETNASHTTTWTVSHHDRFNGYTPPASTHPASTGKKDVNRLWASRCWIFRPGGTAGQIYTTIQDEWSRVMSYVATVNSPDPFGIGTVELGGLLAPRTRTVSDQPVSEVLRQVLAMKPDAAVWWDYSGSGTPSIHVRVASLETALDLVIREQVLSGYSLKVTDDLVPTGVIVKWEVEITDPGMGVLTGSSGLGLPVLTDVYPGMEVGTNVTFTQGSVNVTVPSGTAGLEAGMRIIGVGAGEGAVISTIPTGTTLTMSQAGYLGAGVSAGTTLVNPRVIFKKDSGAVTYQPGVLMHTVTDDMDYVPGIAKEVYNSLAVRRAQGSLTVVDRDFTLGLRPGMVIRLSGDPQLAGIQLWVQRVSWNPDTGLAQLTVGYPVHLQLRDRVDLKGWLKMSFTGVFGEYSSWIVPAL